MSQSVPMPVTPVDGEYSADHKNMLHLIELRWTAVIGQVATILVVAYGFGIAVPVRQMMTVPAFLLTFNVISLFRWRRPRPIVHGQLLLALLVDVGTFTAQMHYSGGTTNPFVFLYLLQVILAAVLLRPAYVWAIVAITCGCIAGLAMFSDPLPIPIDRELGIGSLYVQGLLICFFLNAALLVIFINRINRNLHTRDARLADLRQRAAEEEHIIRMGLLASGAAHELGTPLSTLSVILGDWRHLPEARANPELLSDIDEMSTQLQRCKTIVSQILLAAGEARGESSVETTVSTFLDTLAEEWRSSRAVASFHYINRIQPDLPVVSDSTLKQMIHNVLEASPDWVSLDVRRENDMLRLTVLDRGPGFTSRMLANFGKPYHFQQAAARLGARAVSGCERGPHPRRVGPGQQSARRRCDGDLDPAAIGHRTQKGARAWQATAHCLSSRMTRHWPAP